MDPDGLDFENGGSGFAYTQSGDSGGGPFNSLSYNLQSMLGYSAGFPTGTRILAYNLTIGQPYQIQLWSSIAYNSNTNLYQMTYVSDGLGHTGNLATFGYDTLGGYSTHGVGQYIIGSFVASAEAENIYIYGKAFSSSGYRDAPAYLNAISLSTVPEPSTYAALAGLSVLGFAAYRRRRVA